MISKGYSWIGGLRRRLYRKGWLQSHELEVPVVSIGNISSGGVGKTPLTILLCQQLGVGIPICTLSRGYRAPAEKKREPTVVSLWGKMTKEARDGGDEPLLLASQLSHCSVIAGSHRYRCGEVASALGAKLLVLDDGFQHQQLARSFDIVVIDATDPWGGLLREPKSSLRDADLIALTQADQLEREKLEQLYGEIQKWTKAPIAPFCLDNPVAYCGGERVCLKGKQVLAACGIGRPQRFVETLQKSGAKLRDFFCWSDHRYPNMKALSKFSASVKEADYLLFTEKDWVRFESIPDLSQPTGYLSIQMQPHDEGENWNWALKKITDLSYF